MVKAAQDGAKGFFVDGNPEDCEQGDFFERMIGKASGVICLNISDEFRRKRLLQRSALFIKKLSSIMSISIIFIILININQDFFLS